MLSGVCDLESPDLFSAAAAENPGALFFMIEKNCQERGSAYGELGLDRKGMLNFNGSGVKDFVDLVRRCLAAGHMQASGLQSN